MPLAASLHIPWRLQEAVVVSHGSIKAQLSFRGGSQPQGRGPCAAATAATAAAAAAANTTTHTASYDRYMVYVTRISKALLL